MRTLENTMRFLAGLALLAFAGVAALYALTLYWDVGLPGPHEPGVMHTTSITLGGVTLVGWQMYASYLLLGGVALVLALCGTLLIAKTAIRLTRRCSEPLAAPRSTFR
jgi:hypothetical protein